MGRIAWKQEFDVDDFVFQLSTIRNELKNSNIKILSKVNEHIEEVKELQFLGSPLTDTKLVEGLSKEDMLKFTCNDQGATLCS